MCAMQSVSGIGCEQVPPSLEMRSMGSVLNVVLASYSKYMPKDRNVTSEDVKRAWEQGADFRIIPEGPYLSSRDVEALVRRGHRSVVCHYGDRLTWNVEVWSLPR